MDAVHVPPPHLLLTLPGSSGEHLALYFQPSWPHQEENYIDSLSWDNPPIHCWARGHRPFSSAHGRKTLSFVFCLYKYVKVATPGWTMAHLSLCSVVGGTSHRGNWEIWLTAPFASCSLWLRSFQNLEQHPCAYLCWSELSLPRLDCCNHLLTYLTTTSFSP